MSINNILFLNRVICGLESVKLVSSTSGIGRPRLRRTSSADIDDIEELDEDLSLSEAKDHSKYRNTAVGRDNSGTVLQVLFEAGLL